MKNVVTSDYDLVFTGFDVVEGIEVTGSEGFLVDGKKCLEGNLKVFIPIGIGVVAESYVNIENLTFIIKPSSKNLKSHSLGVILDGDSDSKQMVTFVDPKTKMIKEVEEIKVTIYAKQTRLRAT